jgi:hypothetical protein
MFSEDLTEIVLQKVQLRSTGLSLSSSVSEEAVSASSVRFIYRERIEKILLRISAS